MIYCEYCDYYTEMSGSSQKETGAGRICSFADVKLDTTMEGQKMEYCCRDLSYQAYRNREKARISASRLKTGNWEFAYRSREPITGIKRPRFARESM